MIGFYNYTVVLTYIGTLFGFIGITYTWNKNMKIALMCLMLAGFCDMFDGKIASTMKRTKQEKSFGIQIDSLSDLICFGVLPSMIVLNATEGTVISTVISAVYVLCALIRLAWFNVDEEDRQSKEDGGRVTYLGLPVTTVALILPLTMGISYLLCLPVSKFLHWVLLCVGAAFLTPFHLKKPKLCGKVLMLLVGVVGFALIMMGVRA